MVDLTPEVLQNRMKRGDVYGSEKVERSLKNFFRRGNFIALRELALRQVDVDREFGAKEPNKDTLIANLRFAESLGAQVVRLKGRSVADSVAEFVRSKHVTQVIFGRAAIHDWRKYLYLSAVHRFLRESPAVDVHIVTQESEE